MSSEGCDCPVCGEGYPAGRPECDDIKEHISEVERQQERLRISVDKTPVEAFISEIAQLHALGLPPTQSDINRLLRDTGLDAALHPDEPKLPDEPHDQSRGVEDDL